jgi:hypothetical protein
MDSVEFILTYLGGIVSGFFIKVGGEMLNTYLKRIKMSIVPASQVLTKTKTRHSIALGFGVSIEQGKELDDAYVRLNGKVYPWYENGKAKEKTQLLVGDEPSWFYPYYMSLDYVADVSKYPNVSSVIKREERSSHGLLFTVQDLDTVTNTAGTIVFSQCFGMPKNTSAFNLGMNRLISTVSIRLIGKGVERKMKFEGEIRLKRLAVGKIENGVPFLDSSEFLVEILRH